MVTKQIEKASTVLRNGRRILSWLIGVFVSMIYLNLLLLAKLMLSIVKYDQNGGISVPIPSPSTFTIL